MWLLSRKIMRRKPQFDSHQEICRHWGNGRRHAPEEYWQWACGCAPANALSPPSPLCSITFYTRFPVFGQVTDIQSSINGYTNTPNLEFRCDVTNYIIFLFRVIQPTQPSPTVTGLWEIRPCDSLVGFGRLEVSFYCENVILCENVKNSIFPIKSHFQPTQLLQGRMANRPMTVGLGWVGWMTLCVHQQ